MRSGNIFRINCDNFIEAIYNMLLGESESEEERRNLDMLRGASQSNNQGTYGIPHLTTPPPPPPPPHTCTRPPPPPLPPFNMANAIKMHVFKGQGRKDLEKFQFVAEAVWKSQQINDEYYEEISSCHNAIGQSVVMVY